MAVPKNPKTKPDESFLEFIVNDQLSLLRVDARRMFSGYGLYAKGKFFGIISGGCLYLKTDDQSRTKYVAAGSGPFTPSTKQTLKNYYQVPVEVLEDGVELATWAREAMSVSVCS